MAEQFVPGKSSEQPHSTFGGALRSLRESRGIKQAELARLIQRTPSAVNHWEKRGGRPSRRSLTLVCTALGLGRDERDLLAGSLEFQRQARAERILPITIEHNGYRTLTTVNVRDLTDDDLRNIMGVMQPFVDNYLKFKGDEENIAREAVNAAKQRPELNLPDDPSHEPTVTEQIARLYW